MDICKERWKARGSPRSMVPGIYELVADGLYLIALGGDGILHILGDLAVEDETIVSAFNALDATPDERAFLRRLYQLSIRDRASVVAACWNYWSPYLERTAA